jgi:FKBP-type peptidyl-prolyl cis-trans isomerase FkpA
MLSHLFSALIALLSLSLLACAEMDEASRAFLEAAGHEEGAIVLESGVVYRDLIVGTGAQPISTDRVSANYVGSFIDGSEFQRSTNPIQFSLSGVITCWTQAVPLMHESGTAKLTCPPSTAYGSDGSPPDIPPNAVLVFEVELVDVVGR